MKISVYITSYNQKDYLREAIESVLNQSLKAFQIIIVDDCSIDGSQELIKSYAKRNKIIEYVFHESNQGVTHARISALNMVKGDYVTYVDGDDLYLPKKLEIEAGIIEEHGCDVAFSNNAYVLEKDTNSLQWTWMNDDLKLNNRQNLFVKTITRNFPRESLFRMELINYAKLKQVGFHDSNLKIYEDYDLRIRLAKFCSFGYSRMVTSKVRISESGLSKSSNKLHYKSLIYIFNKYSNDLAQLDQNTRDHVEEKLNAILSAYRPEKKKVSFIKSLRKHLKSLFSKSKL